jgi:endonuclease G
MCPQAPKLNREKWEKLEEKVRNFAEKEGEIWVITGPIFKDINGKQEPDAEIGADRVWVPDAFYKIIIYNESGSAHVIAFEMKNEEETGDFTQYLRSVRDIEGQTGLDFLNVMSADEQNRLETGKAGSKEISKFLN